MRRFMVEAVPLFERESGNKVALRFGPDARVEERDRGGRGFRCRVAAALGRRPARGGGKIAAGTPTDAVRSLVGFVTRAGASKPDIGTVEALKNVLRQSEDRSPIAAVRAVSMWRNSSSASVFAAEMKDKTVFRDWPPGGRSRRQGRSRGRHATDHRNPAGGGGRSRWPAARRACETSSSTPPGSPQTPRIGRRRVPLWGFLPPRGGPHNPRQGYGAGVILNAPNGADVLAPWQLSCPYRLDSARCHDTYRALLAGGELRPSERPVRVSS